MATRDTEHLTRLINYIASHFFSLQMFKKLKIRFNDPFCLFIENSRRYVGFTMNFTSEKSNNAQT